MIDLMNIGGQRVSGFDHTNKNNEYSGAYMPQLVVLVQKTNSNSDRFFSMFAENSEWPLKKLRSQIGKSSLYRLFAYRISELNSILKTIRESLFFVERKNISRGSQILTSYSINPECGIYESENFFILKFNGENGENNHSEKIFSS